MQPSLKLNRRSGRENNSFVNLTMTGTETAIKISHYAMCAVHVHNSHAGDFSVSLMGHLHMN